MHRLRQTAFAFFLIALSDMSVVAQLGEYDIKAGYLYNFSKYVEWPSNAFKTSTAPFVICIAGEDPFGGKIDETVKGRTSGDGRSLEVRRLKDSGTDALRQCQMVFLSKSEKSHTAAIIASLTGASIFTVGDFPSFAEAGGVADLRIEGTKVKVDLNMSAAIAEHLKISGKLQQVSNLVSKGN